MKFKNETGEKLLCHEERPKSSVGREMFWVKPGQVVDIDTDTPTYGEAMDLTHIPEEAPKEAKKAPKEVKAEEGKVGEAVIETKQKKPASKRKK